MIGRDNIIQQAKKQYGVEPDYPFKKLPTYFVLRHKHNDKWFCLVMNVPRSKLGIKGEGEVDVIDLKCKPDNMERLRQKDGVLSAYHMDKKHWLSIVLDGSVKANEIYSLMGDSFELTK